MTDYPAPKTLSHQDLGPILNKIQLLLENLPNQLPSKPVNGPNASQYALLVGFQPDDELLEMTGSRAGALNMHLKHLFGHAARSTGDGILPILERGPPICAIHNVLKDYCAEFPNDNMLKKLAIDITIGLKRYIIPTKSLLVASSNLLKNATNLVCNRSHLATPTNVLDWSLPLLVLRKLSWLSHVTAELDISEDQLGLSLAPGSWHTGSAQMSASG